MQFVKRLIQFALLSAVIYVMLVFVLSRVEMYDRPLIYRATNGLVLKGGDAFQSFVDYEAEQGPHDIIIMGSSHAYRGYDPSLFMKAGYSAFNLGSSSQSPCQSLVVLQDIVETDHRPTILLDIYPQVLCVDDLESGSILISNISSDRAASKIAFKLADIRAINMLTLRLVNSGRPPIAQIDGYVGRGYAANADSVKKEIDYSIIDPPFDVIDHQRICIEQFLRECGVRQLEVVLVSHPRPLELPRARHQEFLDFYADLAKRYDFTLLDYSYDHDLHSRHHFYDHTHLNTAGVEIFNRRLLRDLDDLGIDKEGQQTTTDTDS